MKKTHFQLLALAIMAVVGLTLTGCLKSNDSPGYQYKPKEILLASNAWKISQIIIPGKSGQDSSIFSSCHSQAQVVFGDPYGGLGKYSFKDGAGGCDSNAFHYGTGIWALNPTQDSIYIRPTTDFQNFTGPTRYLGILRLDSTTLQVRFLDSMKENSNILKTITFIH